MSPRPWASIAGIVACLASVACSGSSAAQPSNTAEQYWRELIAKRGADFSQCLRNVELRRPPMPDEGPKRPMTVRNVLIALDSSGSMAGKAGFERKIDAAKRAATDFLERLPADVNVGMIVYGHKGNNRPDGKAVSCAGVELAYPLHPAERGALASSIAAVEPTGWTPLAAAIEMSGAEMTAKDEAEKQNVVYVVSDGLETCGGSAVEAARRLHAANVRTIINIIGFSLNNAEQRELRAVAEAGGGQFFSVGTGDELRRLFDETHERTRQAVYQTANNVAQGVNRTRTSTAQGVTQTCFETKMGVETTAFTTQVNVDSVGVKPKIDAATVQYVNDRLRERHARVREWRDALLQKLESGYQASAAELEADLARVTGRTP
jgi:Ca-activated chloride channel homolog